MRRATRLTLLWVLPAIALVALAIWKLPVRDAIEWIRELGGAGVAVFLALLIGTCVLALPSTMLFLSAGLLYGIWWGTLLTTIGSLASELIVLALARTRARRWIEKHAERHAKLAALDRALETSSFVVVWLLRLSPAMPFGLMNWMLAPVRMPLHRRIAAHVLGMGPCNLLACYIGSTLGSVAGLSGAEPAGVWSTVLLVGGVVLGIVAFAITGVVTKRILERGA